MPPDLDRGHHRPLGQGIMVAVQVEPIRMENERETQAIRPETRMVGIGKTQTENG
jgi:hypothetical protein